jgi:phage-related protein
VSELPPIAVVLTADTSDFTSGISKAERRLDGLDGNAKRAGGGMGALKFAAVGAGAVLAAKAVFDFGQAAVDAAQESEIADARLKSIATSMGFIDGAYAGGIARLSEYSTELMKQIGVDDESIKGTQAKLLTFKNLGKTMNETGGMFDRATKAAYDLASAGFGSAEGNAKSLGKALQDPIKGITALGRSGVTFTEIEKEKIKALVASGQAGKAQELVMAAIEKQVGGTAAATATATGKMKVSFGELQEKIGTSILPVISKLADMLIPLFEKLQGPIGKVADMLGNALGKALDALAPVLPVLADAMTKLGAAVGQVLVTAIQVLVPIITPLLVILGNLASQVGPVLAPLLEKIGTLFGEIMKALMPLIMPLTELVMGILDAAGPIIGVVVDVLITLVRALAPVFAAVGQIIPPLSKLIMVVFAALMPILKPLMPVIEALAAIFSDVLTRAIGLIMTALGYMIQGWAKLAPFILNNVTTPVVGFFLQMAEDILTSAAEMFSWIPGLGDKLATARDSVVEFKGTATKAIADAAKTIGTEGEKIGKDLVDNGIAMMKDPANSTRLNEAGKGVGMDMALGIASGITSGQIQVNKASALTIDRAEHAARAAAQSASPSKLFAKIGGDLTAGLVEGVKAGGDAVREALQTTYTDWFSSTVETLKGKLADAKDALQSFKSDVASALTSGIDFAGAATGGAERAAAITAAQKSLDEAKAKAAAPDATESDKTAVGVAQSALDAASAQGTALGTTFMDSLNAQAVKALEFAEKVKTLISMKLSREALTQVLAAGADAGIGIADELIAGGATTITAANDLVTTTQAAADRVAEEAGVNFEGAGVASANETLKGFKKEFGKDGKGHNKMMKVMDNLAKDAARSVKIDVEVTKNITEIITRIPGADSKAIPRAFGGPVLSGMPYWVGEQGPELFVPNGISGSIVPNDKLKSSEQTINVYAQTNADAHGISREIAWALKVGV